MWCWEYCDTNIGSDHFRRATASIWADVVGRGRAAQVNNGSTCRPSSKGVSSAHAEEGIGSASRHANNYDLFRAARCVPSYA
jgi:hypothetical protein